jgi:tRNA (guanine37-N1)-methyltransferase
VNIKVVSIFPQSFPGTLGVGLIGKSMNKLWNLETIDLKQYAGHLDDRPFGGGNGMVILPQIMERAIEENSLKNIIFLSPRGKVFNQRISMQLAEMDEISVICGRYEGIDQRVIEHYDIQEISIGDFILCGGESAALVLIESVIRNLDGVLGNQQSLMQESFSEYLLEYHQYTQPKTWKNRDVDEILRSGHHAKIDHYRHLESIRLTQQRRPDLFLKYLNERLLIFLMCSCAIINFASS